MATLIDAKLVNSSVADRCYAQATGVVTLKCTYPRIVHAELLTHRTIARNSASSRAIPYSKLREAAASDLNGDSVLGGTFFPLAYWGKDAAGMQAGQAEAISKEEGDGYVKEMLASILPILDKMAAKGVHKSLLNRYLEPYTHITIVESGTRRWLNNLLRLRYHSAAERHLSSLAAIKHTLLQGDRAADGDDGSGVALRRRDQVLHLPFVDSSDMSQMGISPEFIAGLTSESKFHSSHLEQIIDLMTLSAARAARVSYEVSGVTGKAFTIDDDIRLGSRILWPEQYSELPHEVMLPEKYEVLHGTPLEHPMLNNKAFTRWFGLDLIGLIMKTPANIDAVGVRSIVSPHWVTLRQMKELHLLTRPAFVT